jgi:hypothetical protein
MPDMVNNIVAIATGIVLLLAWRGFVGHTLSWRGTPRSATFHLALGTCALIWAVIFRMAYWDVAPVAFEVVEPGLWGEWAAAVGWTDVNIIFDALLLFGSWHLLRALQMLVPEEERHLWPMWRAPFYPQGNVLERFWKWLKK